MKKEMLINVLQPEECRIAIVEDGVLEELYVERTSQESYTGNIYKGRIVNLEPAIQAAFVDFSVGRNGFLHVSDVEPQYFDRHAGPRDEPEAGPRERDRSRERRRDPRRERDRGRDDRRRVAPPPEPLDPFSEELPPVPPRIEERPRDRDRERDRDRPPRDKDRNRERERPDQSIKGRRDRSEGPRRFGEGLIEPAEVPLDLSEELEPLPPLSALPAENAATASAPLGETRAPVEDLGLPTRDWGQGILWPSESEIDTTRTGEPFLGQEPPREEPIEPLERGTRPPGPFEADLPPSRTQRSRPPSGRGRRREPDLPDRGEHRFGASLQPEAEEPEAPVERPYPADREPPAGREPGRDRGRHEPQGRYRPGPAARPEEPFGPENRPAFGPEETGPELFRDELPGTDEPPRRRGGRAAIRARGGDWDRPHETTPAPEVDIERLGRAPREVEGEQTAEAFEPKPEPPRRRAPRGPESGRQRERRAPHDRAGEPGYVPRRERLRSGEQGFGADLFPPETSWAERDIEPGPVGEGEFRTPELAEEDELGFLSDTGAGGPARPEGRKRRRRRGRRRERGRPGKHETAGSGLPPDELEADLEDFDTEIGAARMPARGHAPGSDLDELDIEEFEGPEHQGLEDDELISDEITVAAPRVAEEEIDEELEQEIRREIEEIEELEREMGMRAPADARGGRGDEPARGGRFNRGRGLVKPPIQEIFRRGDDVLVQVIKESIGTKGPTLSTYISIPGRYLVLMPGLNRVGVSRKIVDEGQRRKLREIMRELNPPKGLGFIVRTAGLERTKRELARDLAYLLRLWKVILRRIKKSRAPTPIYQESDMIIRTIRDIFNSEIDTIWIDEPSAFERASDFLRVVMPRYVSRIKLYDEKVPLFHKYGIEDEIAKIQRRHVPLPEGGSIVIDPTEALVAIDVNSGNFRVEDDAERTAYEMNLRAAKEIARQLRLRDLGGVIVNDFIDMREERHRRGVERALREAIKRDRARTKVLRMSAFGLIEMTRQRIRPSLKRSIYEDCSHCAGAGVTKTAESMAIDVMRLLALATHRDEIRRIALAVNHKVAAYLANRKRKDIARLELDCNMTIHIETQENAPAEYLKVECFDSNGNEVRLLAPQAPGHKRGH